MANPERVKAIFEQTQAIITGSHIVYTSGRHGESYVNKDAVYPHTQETSDLCLMTAEAFQYKDVQAVVGPALGGIILSQWTAHHLSRLSGHEVLGVYAEKQSDGSFALTRGYGNLIARKRVLVVEDVLTTGGSVKKVLEALKPLEVEVVGVGALCNRGGVKPEDIGGFHLNALINVVMKDYDPAECPLCESGVPINTTVGKGKEFLAARVNQ